MSESKQLRSELFAWHEQFGYQLSHAVAERDRLRTELRQEKEHHEFYRQKASDYMGNEIKLQDTIKALRADNARLAAALRGFHTQCGDEDCGACHSIATALSDLLRPLADKLQAFNASMVMRGYKPVVVEEVEQSLRAMCGEKGQA